MTGQMTNNAATGEIEAFLLLVFAGISTIVFIITLLIAGAALFIWALNTLFGTGIPYTPTNIVAALILLSIVGGSVTSSNG